MCKRKTFFFLLTLVLFLPILLLGGPGFYGDDLNFIESISQNGAVNGIQNWLSNYGVFYRPIGVSFLYLIYKLLGFSEALVYFSSYAIYFAFIFSIFKCLELITKNLFFTIFVTSFVALFPLAPTVFLQISSTYQALTACLVVILISVFYLHKNTLTNKKLTLFAISWFFLLLTYEQITGLIVIFGIISFLTYWPFKSSLAIKQIIKVIFTFSFVTLVFTSIYISAAGNPKLITLKSLNNTTAIEQAQVSEAPTPARKTTSRSGALVQKILKVLNFFSSNIIYSLNELIISGWKGFIIALTIIGLCFFVLFIPMVQPSTQFCTICIIIGSAWFTSTLAPFFLYKAVHLPPYVMLIPSIGLAIFAYGIYWIIWSQAFFSISSKIFKFIFILIILVFPLQQYGYYFGLKEELAHWRALETRLRDEKPKLLAGEEVVLLNIQHKNNEHIFWLEEAIGKRYFKVLMGEQFTNLALEYSNNKTELKIYLKDQNI